MFLPAKAFPVALPTLPPPMMIMGALISDFTPYVLLYNLTCSSEPAKTRTVLSEINVFGWAVRNFPRSHTPTTLTPTSCLSWVSLSIFPTKDDPVTKASAICKSSNLPTTWAQASPPLALLDKKTPIISPKCSTCVLPASLRISSEWAKLQVVMIGTSLDISLIVNATLVFNTSDSVDATSAAWVTLAAW